MRLFSFLNYIDSREDHYIYIKSLPTCDSSDAHLTFVF